MSGIRVWLDMSALFSDVRQQSCVSVHHDKMPTVKDVQDHIRRVFGIDKTFHILNDGFLLPPSESSLILRDNDCISITTSDQKSTEMKQESRPKQSEERTPGKITIPDAFAVAGTLTDEPAQSNGIVKPTSFENMTISFCHSRQVSVQPAPSEQSFPNKAAPALQTFPNTPAPPLQTSLKAPAPPPQTSNGHSVNETPSQDLDSNSETDSGRKRKRIRRRKKKPSQDGEPKAKEVRLSPYILNKYNQGVSHVLNSSLAKPSNKKHIFFQDEHEKEMDTNVELSGNENLVPAPTLGSSTVGDLSKLMSLGNQKGPAVFERKKDQATSESKAETLKPVLPVPEKPAVPTAPKLVTLDSLPVKETTIKFKILKMVNYSPVVSEEITARVISPDFTSNQLFLQILEGLSELQTERGKFSLDDGEGEEGDSAPSEYVYLNFLDMIEARAVQYH
ncbi:coilin [Frankliniella occidentalis]|uniref:Coilin n=1 Tax=Frankliniella occidentalis TaxID=133901 RepID=A0A6J1S988_FRAOC|nr:coilin [Frankliniella occidentalis]